MKKPRQYGMGSLFQKTYSGGRKANTWTIQFSVDGKRVREATGLRSRAEAQKLLAARLFKVGRGEYVKTQTQALRCEDLYNASLAESKANGRTGGAKKLVAQWREHLAPVFGLMRASRVTTTEITNYQATRREQKAAPATINREVGALRHMFKLAARSGRIEKTPHFPMLKENNVRTAFVEQANFDKLCGLADELWLRTFLELGYSYAWRRGELLNLRVRNVNLLTRKIRLDVGSTKNKKGREVIMTGKVQELLRACCAGKKPEDHVLTRKGNRPVRHVNRAWNALCVRAGLGGFVCKGCGAALEASVKRTKTGGWRVRCARCAKCGAKCSSRRARYVGLIRHDLRRSGAKAMRLAGVPESLVMLTGGWETASMFRRYAIESEADQLTVVAAIEKARAARPAPAIETPAANQPALKLQ